MGRLHLLIGAAKGLEHLHLRKIIHRDIKPSNLLITKNWNCKITDFGISTVCGADDRTLTFAGTSYYIAPEILNYSTGKYNEKADVYSFGITMAEVLTNKKAYYEDIVAENSQLMLEIVNNDKRPDVDILPKQVQDLFYEIVDKNPDIRPN